jgi:TonB family protein
MPAHPKKKQFVNLPRYPGGSAAMKEFIGSSLVYPASALAAGVDGSVIVEYEISDDGLVEHPRILKSLGHGCDEEAIRVVGLLRFEKVRNRGVRVRVTTKTRIHFSPPGMSITYTTSTAPAPAKKEPGKEGSTGISYDYTISF